MHVHICVQNTITDVIILLTCLCLYLNFKLDARFTLCCMSRCILGDDETCLTLQSVAMDRIENLNCVMNSILTNYPEVSSSCIKNSLATLTDSSKCKFYLQVDIVDIVWHLCCYTVDAIS